MEAGLKKLYFQVELLSGLHPRLNPCGEAFFAFLRLHQNSPGFISPGKFCLFSVSFLPVILSLFSALYINQFAHNISSSRFLLIRNSSIDVEGHVGRGMT